MNRSREYVGALLRKATEDEQAMVLLITDLSSADWIIGFHAQQAVEKAIKAVLANEGVEYPLTHNLSVLLDHVRSAGLALPSDAVDLPASGSGWTWRPGGRILACHGAAFLVKGFLAGAAS